MKPYLGSHTTGIVMQGPRGLSEIKADGGTVNETTVSCALWILLWCFIQNKILQVISSLSL